MKPHQISAFFLLMTVLLSSTLAHKRLHVFCEAAALQEPTTHQQGISSTMHTTADHSLLTSSHKEDRQSRLAASPARPEAPEREKELTTHQQGISSTMHTTADHSLPTSSHKDDRQSRLAASPARPEAPKKKKVDGLITGGQMKNGAAVSKERADWPEAPKKKKVDGLITGGQPKNGAASKERAEAKPAKQCCFTYFPKSLRMDLIVKYEETRGDCPKPGIIIYTKKGNEVCVNPSDHWVQEVKKKLDQRFFQ